MQILRSLVRFLLAPIVFLSFCWREREFWVFLEKQNCNPLWCVRTYARGKRAKLRLKNQKRMGFFSLSFQACKNSATPRGFEPLRTKSTHLAGERLNHSAKVSSREHGTAFEVPSSHTAPLSKNNRQQQDLNLRGQSPSDFKSDSLTTRTCCHSCRLQCGWPG